jgi:hypothetical protein
MIDRDPMRDRRSKIWTIARRMVVGVAPAEAQNLKMAQGIDIQPRRGIATTETAAGGMTQTPPLVSAQAASPLAHGSAKTAAR